jgi:hypothetical protein
MAAKRSSLWFGFLEAGEKGSPIILDRSLDVPGRSTIYLFNLKKDRFVEYRRDIVEPKLRELTADELGLIDELQKAYDLARPGFVPRVPPPTRVKTRTRRREPEPEGPDFELEDGMPIPFGFDDTSEAEAES